jgi:hypothetical protein
MPTFRAPTPLGSQLPIATRYLYVWCLLLQTGYLFPRTQDVKVLYIIRVVRRNALVNACSRGQMSEPPNVSSVWRVCKLVWAFSAGSAWGLLGAIVDPYVVIRLGSDERWFADPPSEGSPRSLSQQFAFPSSSGTRLWFREAEPPLIGGV